MTRNTVKRGSVVLLAALVLLGAAPGGSAAQPAAAGGSADAVPAQPGSVNTPKEEIVYANLDAAGAVREINVVNLFDLDAAAEITDYGEYTSLRNMTTTDPLVYRDGVVTVDAQAGRLYYEGRLDRTALPWDVSVRYTLDGRDCSAQEAAGKSGALKITVSITRGGQDGDNFFDGYALQASLTLDGDRCRNVASDQATIANVGGDKQLSFIVLPGRGAELTVTADVTDFEMDGISLNAIPLRLHVEVDDDALTGQISELQRAVEQLDDGADNVKQGADALSSGTETLPAGVDALKSGAQELDDGIAALSGGVDQIQAALDALSGQSPALTGGSAEFRAALRELQSKLQPLSALPLDFSALTEAAAQVRDGIDRLDAGLEALGQAASPDAYKAALKQNGLDLEQLKSNNAAAAAALRQSVEGLKVQIAEQKAAGADTAALEEQAALLQAAADLLAGNNQALAGTEAYLQQLGERAGELRDGAAALRTGYDALYQSLAKAAPLLSSLPGKLSELTGAVDTLVNEYEALHGGIGSYTDAVAQIVAGYGQIGAGVRQLAAGSGALCDGVKELDENADTLVGGIAQLSDGSAALKEGTGALRRETAGMDAKVSAQIDDAIRSLTGGDTPPQSFVNARNTQVKAVQFVLKTEGVKKPAPAPEPEPEPERLTFWQKLLRLFGLY